jgi:hypothetical protein
MIIIIATTMIVQNIRVPDGAVPEAEGEVVA